MLYSVEGITTDKSSLCELIDSCNKGKLSSIHIQDVINDFVEQKG